RAAKGSRLAVGGVPLNFGQYNWDRKGDDLDTTNFESGGDDQGTIGILGMDFSGGGLFDQGQIPVKTIPGIFPRADLANIQFFTNVGDNNFCTVPLARIL